MRKTEGRGEAAYFRLITIKAVAAMLGVSVNTVRRLTDRREIPAAKVGGQWRYDVADVRAFFEARRHGGGGGEAA
jgi:excisionase family DNA binding protein